MVIITNFLDGLSCRHCFDCFSTSFKNGSLTRERIRNHHTKQSWEDFNALLCCTPPGNHGYIGIYFDQQEITPKMQGTFRFDASGNPIDHFEESATEVRAIIEGQFLAKRVHAERLGFNIGTMNSIQLFVLTKLILYNWFSTIIFHLKGPQCRVLATGGASNNKVILQVLSDVFRATVFTQVIAC